MTGSPAATLGTSLALANLNSRAVNKHLLIRCHANTTEAHRSLLLKTSGTQHCRQLHPDTASPVQQY